MKLTTMTQVTQQRVRRPLVDVARARRRPVPPVRGAGVRRATARAPTRRSLNHAIDELTEAVVTRLDATALDALAGLTPR